MDFERQYSQLVLRCVQLHSLLEAMDEAQVCQGEHTFPGISLAGTPITLKAHIEGTSFELCETRGTGDFTAHVEAGHE
jgi:hypothetical protein